MADKYLCGVCHKPVAVTTKNKFRSHGGGCPTSGTSVPQHQLDLGPMTDGELKEPDKPVYGRDMASCSECLRILVPLDEDGKLKPHRVPLGDELCRHQEATIDTGLSVQDVPTAKGPDSPSGDGLSGEVTTSSSRKWKQPTPEPSLTTTSPAPRWKQPSQPARSSGRSAPAVPMSDFSISLMSSLKETFFQWNNRKTSDNRNAQTTLGPSEIGSPCDRRIVMSLLSVPPVAPGGDGWAAWLGTQGHEGLAKMLQWADGGTGRYAIEVPLLFPSAQVPRGTSDALDRVLRVVADHKFMGTHSLRKLRTKGPSETYRVQVHTYAYGQQLRGEKPDMVAIVGWPRQESSLSDMYVWSEPYDPSVAIRALARVQDLDQLAKARAERQSVDGPPVWTQFPVADDCQYCPFYLPQGDNTFACNGKE